MSVLKTSEQDLAEKLFTLCTQAEASFETQMLDALQASHVSVSFGRQSTNHRELIIFFTWVVRRVVTEYPKILSPLHATHFLSSLHPYFDEISEEQLLQMVTERFTMYDKAMEPAPEPLDLVYVSQVVTPRVFGHDPNLIPHLPKMEIILTRIVSEWVVSIMTTLREIY